VEPLLPGLVNRSHTAAADKLQNVDLRELLRQLLGRGRDEAMGFGFGRSGGRAFGAQANSHQALRAQTLDGFLAQRLPAMLTDLAGVHGSHSPSTTTNAVKGSQHF